MARGWESKAIEAQQEAASDRAVTRPPVSPDEAARRAQRATLLLARTRAEADLARATAAAHQSMLRKAIEDLDRQIAAIESRR